MKLIDFRMHFIERLTPPWLEGDPCKNTVDQIVYGDPEREIESCVVTWTSSFVALRKAIEKKVDLVVTHEPTFYVHSFSELEDRKTSQLGMEKLRFIQVNDIAIMRLHDRWDIWPDFGIPWSWAEFLELPKPPVAIHRKIFPGTLHRYDIMPITLGEFAKHVAFVTTTPGEPHPIVIGDLDQIVSKVGVGAGCGCQLEGFRELGCDVSLVCDDGTRYWSDIQRYEDEDHAMIRVNHGTCEEPGMKNLARYINEHMHEVTAEYLPAARKFHQI